MKKTVLWSAVLAMFIFGGCSSKDPSIDATDDSAKTSKSGEGAAMVTDVVEEDVIVVDENAGIEDINQRR